VPEQEEPEQPEDLPKFVVVDDDYYGYYEGGWVENDTEEEPMELPQEETILKMVMITQLHPMVVTRTQRMI
jgi:hypothetical protein